MKIRTMKLMNKMAKHSLKVMVTKNAMDIYMVIRMEKLMLIVTDKVNKNIPIYMVKEMGFCLSMVMAFY